MPKLKHKLPSYRLHKRTGQAVVTLGGRDHYLGKHGTRESFDKYKRLIAECGTFPSIGSIQVATQSEHNDLRICELFLAYLDHATGYYMKNGRPTGEITNIKHAMIQARCLYGESRVVDFGPCALKVVRNEMIHQGLSRKVINSRVNRLRRVFKWGVENELVGPTVLHALQAVSPLKSGRTTAKERDPVKPVPLVHIDAVRPHVSRPIQAMIDVQLLTGMRPGEVVMMRCCDLDLAGKTWTYRPAAHKTEHHGIDRVVFVGPKAQEVIVPFLRANAHAYLFRPVDAIRDLHERRREQANAVSQKKRPRKSNPQKHPGDHYTTKSYCYAIHKACNTIGIPCWGPNRLRHNAATYLRKEYGIEVARVILGHRTVAVTEVYAEMDLAKAAEIMSQVG